MKNRIKTVAVAAVVSALTVAGLAVAQSGDGDGNGDGQDERGKRVVRFHGPPPGGPMLLGGPRGGQLTYSETHLRRDGEDVVVRADRGKVTAASDDSISIERNDGETVEVAVDGETKVLAGPARDDDAGAADIPDGKRVLVIREDGDDTAEAVLVEPSRKDRLELRHRLGGPPPDGPGGEWPAPPPSFDGEQG